MSRPVTRARTRTKGAWPLLAFLLIPSSCLCEPAIRDSVTRDRTGLEACTAARVECAQRARTIVDSVQLAPDSDVERAYEQARASVNSWCERQASRLRAEKTLTANEADFRSQVRPAVDAFLSHPVPRVRTFVVEEMAVLTLLAIKRLRHMLEQERLRIIDDEVRRLDGILTAMHWPSFQEIAREAEATSPGGTH